MLTLSRRAKTPNITKKRALCDRPSRLEASAGKAKKLKAVRAPPAAASSDGAAVAPERAAVVHQGAPQAPDEASDDLEASEDDDGHDEESEDEEDELKNQVLVPLLPDLSPCICVALHDK